jgi:hypothetical protein
MLQRMKHPQRIQSAQGISLADAQHLHPSCISSISPCSASGQHQSTLSIAAVNRELDAAGECCPWLPTR